MKSVVFFFLVIFAGFFLDHRPASGQNIALTKPYTISPAPNLLFYPDINKNLVLTDGEFSTGGYFWSQSTSLSWVKASQVICTIDIGKIEVISAVSFNTCRRVDSTFNVRFPSHIFVFISNDNKYFKYAGDAALSPGNMPGPYEIKKFTLENIGSEARYVKLVVILSGLTLSCDEIEVMKGRHIQKGFLSGCNIGNIGKYADSLISNYNVKNHLVQEGAILMSRSKNERNRLSLDHSKNQNHSSAVFSADFSRLKLQVRSLYLSDLRSRFKGSLLLYKTTPWDTLSTVGLPSSVAQQLNYSLIVPVGGHGYGSFVLINTSDTTKTIYIAGNNPVLRFDSIQLFHAHYVQASKFRLIPDALVPLPSDQFSIDPGRPELFIFKITGDYPGTEVRHLTISSGNNLKQISIKLRTVRIDSFNNFKLNTNVWI